MLLPEAQQQCAHMRCLGIKLIQAEPGSAMFGLDWRDELMATSTSHMPASAPIFSLMEAACAHAIWSVIERPESTLILSLRVDHLRSATPGRRLIGQAECFRVTKRIAFARGVAYDKDEADPVVNVIASFFYTQAK